MGALNPLFLVAALAVGVPLFLHLFHRQQARRISFPALRYLERTEREHAREIRARQLLLLLLRVGVLLAVVVAGARLFVRGRGAAHPPTALVIVLDNSASSGRVVGERRVLDRLKEITLAGLSAAGPEDRVWVLRAGEPWAPAVPQGADAARETVEETTVSAAAADLGEAIRRARELVGTAPLTRREIHVLSDLQASALSAAPTDPDDTPLVVWRDPEEPSPNRALLRVLVGGGLPPLAGERTEVTVQVAAGAPDDTVPIPVRAVVDGRIRGAGSVPPGAAVSIPLPPSPVGWVRGWVETDPDVLRADDRRFFTFRSRPPPSVRAVGPLGPFVEDALAVLEAAGRLRRDDGAAPDLLLAGEGEALRGPASGNAVLVVPPVDPARLPALNRRLAEAGIPWTYGRLADQGEAELAGLALPDPLEGVIARRWYALELSAEPPAPPRTLARVGTHPWAVEGTDGAGRRYLLLASPMDETSSSLPVSTGMVRFTAWIAGSWAASAGAAPDHPAGTPIPAPRAASRVRLPSGDTVAVGGTQRVEEIREVGFYEFLEGDSIIAVTAVNIPPSESDLTVLRPEEARTLLGASATLVTRAEAWPDAVFRVRQGPEMWRLALLLAVLLLTAEALVAAAGRAERTPAGAVTRSGA